MNTLTLPNNKTISVETGSQIEDILDLLEFPQENLVAVKINNEICSLTQKIDVNAKIEPVYLNSTQGSSIYR
ncbi:MAG: nucleoside kinase, partial [Spirochaetaceae bacterium]|nr:nucleoside kinase [Spirochaetaceae bacterium]